MRILLGWTLSLVTLLSSVGQFSKCELEEDFNSKVLSEFRMDLNGNGSLDMDSEEEKSQEGSQNSADVFALRSSFETDYLALLPRSLKSECLDSSGPQSGFVREIFEPPEIS